MDVSRETSERLHLYTDELLKWNKHINLVGRTTEADIWKRHIADSAQLFPLLCDTKAYADLGSGAGFPGLVIAILADEAGLALHVTLVESDKRKAAFLRNTAVMMNLSITIQADRIEAISPLNADAISARALAPLPDLLNLTYPHLAAGGECFFLKGKAASAEISAARQNWRFHLKQHQSTTDDDGVLLQVGALERV
ncbi:16S rRNA (guanine(527)-N(7))-methyltransferase RsmG [Aestuariibius insulae]|uniref:16S rRNA (guanine(527)-N(7))-methyltransferase RsmG n=1 Tax=Aestuariibius insulae TaxID=2058287 RepID=UPI00345ED870